MRTHHTHAAVSDFFSPPHVAVKLSSNKPFSPMAYGMSSYDAEANKLDPANRAANRMQYGAKLNTNGNMSPSMADRPDPIMPYKAGPGEVQRVNRKIGSPLLNSIRAFFDAHAEEFLAFEDARASMAINDPNAERISARGYQHVREYSRVGFMRMMLQKYPHEEYGPQVYYDENHNGLVAPMLPKHATDEVRAAYEQKTTAANRIANPDTVYRHDPNLEPKWKVATFNIITVLSQYAFWRSHTVTPVSIIENITNNFDTDPSAAETFGRLVLDGLTNGEMLAEVAAGYGISYADMQRFIKLCRKKFPSFERDYYQALDDGLEQYLHEIVQELNNSIGYVRDGKQPNISAFNAERQALGELASARKWLVASAKASRYYMGPSKASLEGAAQAAPTIHLNFTAPPAMPINVSYTVDEGQYP
jgi:hypothetical protein